jgi:hypothetical protein
VRSAYCVTQWCCSWLRTTREQVKSSDEASAQHVRMLLSVSLSVSLSPLIFVACRCKCGAIVRRGMARIAATGTWHGCHDTSPHATTVACRCKCGTVALVIVLLAFWALTRRRAYSLHINISQRAGERDTCPRQIPGSHPQRPQSCRGAHCPMAPGGGNG